MLKQLMIGALLLTSVFASNSFAEEGSYCADVTIDVIYASGNRSGDYAAHTQKLIIRTTVLCNNSTFLYVDFNNPAYSSMLTLIMNAQNTGKKLGFFVKKDEKFVGSSEILYVSANR